MQVETDGAGEGLECSDSRGNELTWAVAGATGPHAAQPVSLVSLILDLTFTGTQFKGWSASVEGEHAEAYPILHWPAECSLGS